MVVGRGYHVVGRGSMSWVWVKSWVKFSQKVEK